MKNQTSKSLLGHLYLSLTSDPFTSQHTQIYSLPFFSTSMKGTTNCWGLKSRSLLFSLPRKKTYQQSHSMDIQNLPTVWPLLNSAAQLLMGLCTEYCQINTGHSDTLEFHTKSKSFFHTYVPNIAWDVVVLKEICCLQLKFNLAACIFIC